MQYPPPPPPSNLPPPPPPAGYTPSAYAPQPPPVYAARPPGENLRYAGFWIRFAAALIDWVIVTFALFVMFFAIGFIAGIAGAATGSEPSFTGSTTTVLANVIYYILYAGYYIYFWGMGQTPGMRRFAIYVGDAGQASAIGFGRSSLRLLGYIVSVLPCFIGLIWAAFDPRKQGWHDKIANTVVFYGG